MAIAGGLYANEMSPPPQLFKLFRRNSNVVRIAGDVTMGGASIDGFNRRR